MKYIISYYKLNEYLGSVEVEADSEEKALGKADVLPGWTRREIILLPEVSKEWCKCRKVGMDVFFKEDGECDCGIHKHHYHHISCGKVVQIG